MIAGGHNLGTNWAQSAGYGLALADTGWHEADAYIDPRTDEAPGQVPFPGSSPGDSCLAPPTGFEPVPPP